MQNISTSMRVALLSAAFIVSSIFVALPALAEQVTVTVKGMVCSFCAQGIVKRFNREADVASVNPDLEKRLVVVNLKDGATITDERIKTVVEDAGYEVDSVQRQK